MQQVAGWPRSISISNYASKKMRIQSPVKGIRTTTVDQKYEKIGTLTSKTTSFDADEKAVQNLVKKYDMLTQYEQRSGLKGHRILRTAFGVVPQRFDNAIKDMKKVGTPVYIQIDKKDKTNEYKKLEARKVSLEKTRKSLTDLKKREGNIKELTALEDRILDIENKIQSLGVRLGEYDEENEFCTIKFLLKEIAPAKGIPFIRRAKVAFEWTAKYYALIIVIFFFGSLFGLVSITIIKQIKWLHMQIAEMIAGLK
jgi:hypothetical protein